MQQNITVQFPSNSPAWWEMSEDSRVVELRKQLENGLIHPLEFAYAIVRIGHDYGLPEDAHA